MAVYKNRLFTWWSVALAFQAVVAQDQKCYYPNGNEAPEKPCSSAEGSACCPDKWQCLDNGLCHYPPDNLYGRYSCTDQKWEAEGCPSNMCTYDMSAAGGESITQCSDHNDQWCCNADAVHVNCCKESPEPRPFFELAQGQAYATVGSNQASSAPNLASITGLATGTGSGDSQPSSTSGPSAESQDSSKPTSSNADTSKSPSTPVTSLQTSVSSGSAGVSTMIITSVIQPAASSTSSPSQTSSGSSSKVGLIVGCAVGIPLGIALIGILIWLLRKRSMQKKARPYSETPDPYANGAGTPEFAGGAKFHKHSDTGTSEKSEMEVPELAGQSIGPGRPISNIQGKAELGTGDQFGQGAVPYGPNMVGVGGGNARHTPQSSWGSAPPGYSPGMNQNAFVAEAPDTSVPRPGTGGTTGSAGAAGAAQTGGGRYVPYRPPQGQDTTATGAQQGRPEMAELSAVRTPPE